jgi:hypothetical protein
VTIEIPLSRGLVALVDDIDAALAVHNWHAIPDNATIYAGRHRVGSQTTVLMHREVLGSPPSHVDHINGDGLDNRRANLRLATPSQNGGNRRARVGGSSRFKGVCWHRKQQCWSAYITVDRRRISLGSFQLEEEAARAYDQASRAGFGEFARVNFPEPGEASAFVQRAVVPS